MSQTSHVSSPRIELLCLWLLVCCWSLITTNILSTIIINAFSVATNIKVEQAVPNKKSVFVKKSLVLAGTASTITAPPFKFDFPVGQSENRENNIVDDFSKIKIETTRSSVDDDDKNKQKNGDNKKFQFTLSDNSFRFNFESES